MSKLHLSRALWLLGGASLAALSAGCGSASYVVAPVSSETIHGELSAQWFERDIYDEDGKLDAVELVYCPTVPRQPTTCKTSVIWEHDTTLLSPQATVSKPTQ
jgi:hypothetical protein